MIAMHAETRASAIETISTYIRHADDDHCFSEILGISPSGDITSAQWHAAALALVPLLDDARLMSLMFHIAEVSVMEHESEAA